MAGEKTDSGAAPVDDGQTPGQSAEETAVASTTDQQGGEELFSVDERKGLTPEAQTRLDGAIKKYHQRMNEVAELRKSQETQLQALREQTEEMRRLRESESEPPPVSDGNKSKLEMFLESANPTDRNVLKNLAEAIREDIRKDVQADLRPVAERTEQVRYETEIARLRATHPDFDEVMERNALDALLKRTNIQSAEVAYKTLKHDQMQNDLTRTKAELAKLQSRVKGLAGSEIPGGPSGGMLDHSDWYDKLPREERRKLSLKDMMMRSIEAEKKG